MDGDGLKTTLDTVGRTVTPCKSSSMMSIRHRVRRRKREAPTAGSLQDKERRVDFLDGSAVIGVNGGGGFGFSLARSRRWGEDRRAAYRSKREGEAVLGYL